MKITRLLPEHAKRKFVAHISGRDGVTGRIQFQDGAFYLCQNKVSGNSPDDILGFRYAWCVGTGSKHDIERNSVYNLSLSDDEWDEPDNA
jgi:hypothetical protein